ncbi:MEKHLA domain-containing protein [Cohnella xylanilytica]|nr:MEKHLA domain-containing protein [Cohnella xylanilytica]GIO15960.1 MEKHLA domain-containing protein [Cohnella xylanilytica]
MDRREMDVHIRRLLDSYRRWTGEELAPELAGRDPAAEINEAPFALLSHGTEEDPILNYGNRTALRLWEMDWDSFTSTPSRLTAEPLAREERERFMDDVRIRGYSDGYSGVRVSRTGRRFRIEQAVVWNVTDEDGRYIGQAASFRKWTDL